MNASGFNAESVKYTPTADALLAGHLVDTLKDICVVPPGAIVAGLTAPPVNAKSGSLVVPITVGAPAENMPPLTSASRYRLCFWHAFSMFCSRLRALCERLII
jgi:hypothetical protein